MNLKAPAPKQRNRNMRRQVKKMFLKTPKSPKDEAQGRKGEESKSLTSMLFKMITAKKEMENNVPDE